eukprot:m.29880 g.29880  ORF g.29880 m.29880 type:complete len:678 (-) comp16171_c0_seq2:416-2449(-)
MVHIIDGVIKPGHFPRTGDAYERRPVAIKGPDISTLTPVDAPKGRYHLVVCTACPWAHRAAVVRELKDLSAISISVVSPFRDDDVGWAFASDEDQKRYGTEAFTSPTQDNASGENFKTLAQLYVKSNPKYTGNVTTPVLYDSQLGKIVVSDSWEVIRFMDRAFKPGPNAVVDYQLYPSADADAIDVVARRVQDKLNNGVYQAGMAKSQEPYEVAVANCFEVLDELEVSLGSSRYLVGRNEHLTVADVQLFTTLARFDDIYFPLFKVYKRRLSSYHNISNWLRDIYQIRGVAATIDAQQTKDHYFTNFTVANPNGVVPLGSVVPSFNVPHDRAEQFEGVTDEHHDEDGPSAKRAKIATEEDQATKKARQAKGEFVRGVSAHRGVVTKDGAAEGEFKAESGRYELYIANNCPWCGRTATARAVLGLEDTIKVNTLFYRRNTERGWQFLPDDDSELRDVEKKHRSWLLDGAVDKTDANGFKFARQVYEKVGSKETSVPFLFDTNTQQIVNNESAEIVRMFSQGFVDFHKAGAPDLYPPRLMKEIDALNAWIYPEVNNGAYKAGFSSNQEVYEKAYHTYFNAWDKLEKILSSRRYLTGEHMTEADVRLFPTIVRHDPVYFSRMKLNKAMVVDYPHLHRWMRDLLRDPAVAAGTNVAHCRFGYFGRTGNNNVPELQFDTQWY